MKIRHDAVAVSSILFTLALLWVTPPMLGNARATYQSRLRDISSTPEAGIAQDQVVIPNYDAPIGITSLAIIVIGLVVTWAGYIRGARWTWFVMFVVVWVWAFPVLLLPSLQHMAPIKEWLPEVRESGSARNFVELVLIFLLMVLALALPVKTFLLGQGVGPGRSGRTNLGAPDKSGSASIR